MQYITCMMKSQVLFHSSLFSTKAVKRTAKKLIEITGEDGAWNRVWISEDSVKMESASCPDGLCVHQGAISDGLLPIVCLPNKVQIQIVEDNHEE